MSIPRLICEEDQLKQILNIEKSFSEMEQGNIGSEREITDIEAQTTDDSVEIEPTTSFSDTLIQTFTVDAPIYVRDTIVEAPERIVGAIVNAPATLAALPANAVTFASDMATKATEMPATMSHLTSEAVATVIDLPNKAKTRPFDLLMIMGAILAGGIGFFGIFNYLPITSIHDGLAANRMFLYVTQTFSEAMLILPWIYTIHNAMPEEFKISFKNAFFVFVKTLAVVKLFDAILVEGWNGIAHAYLDATEESDDPIIPLFPIPFSVLYSTLVALPAIVYFMWLVTPNRNESPFNQIVHFLFALIGSFLSIGSWALGMKQLEEYPLYQRLFSFMYMILRFTVKIPLLSNITTRLDGKSWVNNGLIIDMSFVMVHQAIFPFIGDGITLCIMLLTDILVLFWRLYAGVDRFQMWAGAITNLSQQSMCCNAKPSNAYKHVSQAFGKSFCQITYGCYLSSTAKVLNVACSLRKLPADPKIEEESKGCWGKFCAAMKNCFSSLKKACCVFKCCRNTTSKKDDNNIDVEKADPIKETTWEQRFLFHALDSISSAILSVMLRVLLLFGMYASKNYAHLSEHLTESFDITDAHSTRATILGCMYMVMMVGTIVSIVPKLLKWAELKDGNKITLRSIIYLAFKENFWFFLLWVVAMAAYQTALMVEHFGCDFSLKMDWLS